MKKFLHLTLLFPITLYAAEPKPSINGPTKGFVGQELLYRLTNSVSDDPLQVQFIGPGTAEVFLSAKDQKPALAVVVPAQPGSYFIAVVAAGTPEGKSKTFAFAFWKLDVVGNAPTPL